MSDINPTPSNPFYHRTPIHDPAHFFGRVWELRQLDNLITNGQSVALIGPRRIGKSSLLCQLMQQRAAAEHGMVEGMQRFVYFSGEAWQDQSTDMLYAALWSAIYTATQECLAAIASAVDFPDPLLVTLDFPTFHRALQLLRNVVPRLVLLIDEFDALSHNRHLDETFFSSLRSLAATQEIVFVTASTQPLLELTYAQQSALSSPFFNIFLPQRLGLLPRLEALALLDGTAALGGVVLDPRESAQLLNRAGPHPFFLKIAGYHWWEAREKGVTTDEETMQQVTANEADPHWHYQWRYLTVEQQRTLALLATGQPQSTLTLQQLQHACLVRLNGERATYLSPLLQTFVRQQTVHGILRAGSLLVDQQQQQAWVGEMLLTLAPQDYRLLEALAMRVGHSVSHAALAQTLWPEEQAAINHPARLKTAINSLRRKLGDQAGLIATDAGGGYRLVAMD